MENPTWQWPDVALHLRAVQTIDLESQITAKMGACSKPSTTVSIAKENLDPNAQQVNAHASQSVLSSQGSKVNMTTSKANLEV